MASDFEAYQNSVLNSDIWSQVLYVHLVPSMCTLFAAMAFWQQILMQIARRLKLTCRGSIRFTSKVTLQLRQYRTEKIRRIGGHKNSAARLGDMALEPGLELSHKPGRANCKLFWCMYTFYIIKLTVFDKDSIYTS